MDYNFHAHTYRCRHAGTEREKAYIEAALEAGITRFGFSEHAPRYNFDGTEAGYTLPYAQVEDYFSTVRALREEYCGKMEIYIGFEAEYYPQNPAYTQKMISLGAEYMILGQHMIVLPNGQLHYVVSTANTDETLRIYADTVIAALYTGKFTYLAHPDVFSPRGCDPALYEWEMRRICMAAEETDTPLEINFLGIREQRFYPNPAFWKVAGAVGAPVTFGLDAHSAAAAKDRKSLVTAQEMVKAYGLRYIGAPCLRRLG